MIAYFSRIPAAALRREIDGNLYALVPHHITPRGIREDFSAPRMVRADGCEIRNGEAWVLIGCMGDAIAQTTCLPFGVSFLHE